MKCQKYVLSICLFFFPLSSVLSLSDGLQETFLNERKDDGVYFEFLGWPWGRSERQDHPFKAEKLVNLESHLRQRLVGQDQAIKATVAALERYAHDLHDAHAPIASLLFIGPTGVGKTQLAKELAKHLLGGEQHLLRLNMVEYQDAGSVYRLIGTPPGFLGHREGGQFTEALKQNQYAIVLLDEVEKAHPFVLKTFLQLFEEGMISDAKGQLVDCRNCFFILTTNLGGQKVLTMHDLGHTDREISTALQPTLMQALSPELYNRLEPVIFRGLKGNVFEELIQNLLLQAIEDLQERKKIEVKFDSSVVDFFKSKSTNYLLGARPIKHLIREGLITAITEAFKEDYIQIEDKLVISYAEQHFRIHNSLRDTPFIWKWQSEDPSGMQPPFKLNQLLSLGEKLKQKILGQPYAIDLTVAALIRYAAGLGNTNSPIGAFLYVGPTGVGKTQLAKELSYELLGSESHLIRLDMSEYSEPHSISRLIGSPPGYINHDEGGQLTEALKQHPHAVVLLDEVEKAHPSVLKTFLQVFDEGHVSDAQGSMIDCRNVIFILTTNLASQKILKLHQEGHTEDEILEKIQYDVTKFLSPELFNRLEVALFKGLNADLLDQMIKNMLQDVQKELYAKKKIHAKFDVSLIAFLRENGFDYALGARPLKRLIQQTIVTSIAKAIIADHLSSDDAIELSYENDQLIIKKMEGQSF